MRTYAIPFLAAALVLGSACAEEQYKDLKGQPAPALAGPVWAGMPVSLDAVKGNGVFLVFWNGDAPC